VNYQPYRDICRRMDREYERIHGGLAFEHSTKAARSTFYDESRGVPRAKARILSVPRMFLGRRLAEDPIEAIRQELLARWPDRLPFQLKPRKSLCLQEEDDEDEDDEDLDEDDDEDDEDDEEEEI
jgi:hypothetical protein